MQPLRRSLPQRAYLAPSRIRLARDYHPSHEPTDLISIKAGTFYHNHPSSSNLQSANPPYFPNLHFTLRAPVLRGSQDGLQLTAGSAHWAVIGSRDNATFLEVLRGNLICDPPTARKFPYLSSDNIANKDTRLRIPQNAIKYVGFNAKNNSHGPGGGGGVVGAYLSARYESHREETDWSVLQYLKGDTELNPDTQLSHTLSSDDSLLIKTIANLRLEKLVNMPVANLSNGQTRRARIAKALLSRPQLLLLDEPFMGLDPPTLTTLSPLLRDLAHSASPLLMLGLRPQDPIPDWITHLVVLGAKRNLFFKGEKGQTLFKLRRFADLCSRIRRGDKELIEEEGLQEWIEATIKTYGEPLEGVGDMLTASGVKDYEVYDRVLAEEHSYFSGAFVQADILSENDRQIWKSAKRKSVFERTDDDWWTLTAAIPERLSQPKNGGPSSTSATSAIAAPPTTQPSPSASSPSPLENASPLIELNSIVLRYGTKTVLGHPPPQPGYSTPGLNLTIRRGSRLALLGPNGSGKTTLLSLLTSDHPQSYSLPIRFFGRDRLPSPGIPGLSLWEIQSRIGHSSPEVHAFFPKKMSVRRVLENAWAETFGGRPEMNTERTEKVNRVLRWWEDELRQGGKQGETVTGAKSEYGSPVDNSLADVSWADDKIDHAFGLIPFSAQRLLLLLRAVIKVPDIIVLDEAFSGLSSEVRDKAMCFLEYGETRFVEKGKTIENRAWKKGMLAGLTDQQALIVVSHLREEIPPCVNEWIRLPSEEEAMEMEKPVLMGRIEGEGIRGAKEWNRIWGL